MYMRITFLAPALWLLSASNLHAQEAPSPSRSWPAIVAENEAGPGPAPDADATGFSYSAEGDGFFQAEATKPDNTTTKGAIFDETNLYGHFNWSNWATVNGALKYEHQRFNNSDDYYPDRTSFMRSEGLSLRQIYLTVRPDNGSDAVALYAGKIHPHFGTGWSNNGPPGIFYSFGSDYEQDEMIGFGADVKIPSVPATKWLGAAYLSAETFFLDTTFLSNSLFAHPSAGDMFVDRPGRFTLTDGGAANTNDFDSVTVALQGQDIFGATGAAYHLSYTHAGVHLPDEKPETGFSAAGTYTFDLGNEMTTAPYIEYARLNNFGGQADLDRNYVIWGLTSTKGKWELDLAGGARESHDAVAGTDQWDLQENISLTYEVIEKLRVGGGFNHIRVNDVGSNTLGLEASYEFSL